MKALTIPLLALLLTTAASGQLFNITLNGRVDTIENNTGLALDNSVYPGSPMTINVSWNRDDLEQGWSYTSPDNTEIHKVWDGARLSVIMGNYGLSTVDALLTYNVRTTGSSSVTFLSDSNMDVIKPHLLGSLLEGTSEIPLASDPLVKTIIGLNGLETSMFAGETNRVSEFENLLFNDPSFLETLKGTFQLRLFDKVDKGGTYPQSIRYLLFSSSTDEGDSPSGTAVPEPSTYGLFGALGLVALIGHRRFRPFEKSL